MGLRSACEGCHGHPATGLMRFGRRDVLCLEGDAADALFPIVSGFARELRTLPDGRLQALRLLRPGDVAGIEALHAQAYRSTVECITRVRACRVRTAEAGTYLVNRGDMTLPLLRMVEEQAAQLGDAMVWLGQGSAEERVLGFIEHLLAPYPRSTWVRVPLTRGEIAEFLGLGLTTVSRVVQRLARRGALEVSGRSIRLCD